MPLSEADLVSAIRSLQSEVDRLKSDVRRLNESAGRWDTTTMIHPAAANLSNIRDMLMLEILRQKGLLDGLDMAPITEAVKGKLARKRNPWGAGQETALTNLDAAVREIAGEYDQSEDDAR